MFPEFPQILKHFMSTSLTKTHKSTKPRILLDLRIQATNLLLICDLQVFSSSEPDPFTSTKFYPLMLLPAYHRFSFIATMGQLISHTTSVLSFPTDVVIPFSTCLPLQDCMRPPLVRPSTFTTCQPWYIIHPTYVISLFYRYVASDFPIDRVGHQLYDATSRFTIFRFWPVILSATSFAHNLAVISLPSHRDARPLWSLRLLFRIGYWRGWTFTT